MKFFIPFLCIFFHTSSLFGQVDTVPPVLQCLTLSIYDLPEPLYMIFADELIDTVYDNHSANADIEIGIRRVCTGEGFPEDTLSVYIGFGVEVHLEIWARDEAGNTTVCYVSFTPFYPGTGMHAPMVFFNAQKPEVDTFYPFEIPQVRYAVSGVNCNNDSLAFELYSDITGSAVTPFSSISGRGYVITLQPSKDMDPLNGVTTFDMLIISRHILGVEPLDSPYKLIAADVNQDGQVTLMDIIIMRRLILGITDELPNGKSWRFMPFNYAFPNPANPFQEDFPEYIVTPAIFNPSQVESGFRFIGVKIGDVNFSADPSQ